LIINTPFLVIETTSLFKITSPPFWTAFSINAIVYSNGPIIPPVGANKAPLTSLLILGSIFSVSSLFNIFNPFTPFFSPFLKRVFIVIKSSLLKANTSEPFLLNGTCNSLQILSNILFPFTLYLAINVPSLGSYPAWTIAEFAFDVPIETSFSFSITMTFKLYFVNSLNIDAPITPAPIIATSYINFTSYFFTLKSNFYTL